LKSNLLKVTVLAVALSLAVGIAACGSSSDSGDNSSDTGTSTSNSASTSNTTSQTPANAQSVKVGLTEMAISVSPDSVKAGDVKFEVSNDGSVEHELVVIKTNKKAADLPTDSTGKADETGSVGETEVQAGASSELDLKLAAGHYALICNLPGHYAAGMYKDFTVK